MSTAPATGEPRHLERGDRVTWAEPGHEPGAVTHPKGFGCGAVKGEPCQLAADVFWVPVLVPGRGKTIDTIYILESNILEEP
jgi:hypothetical protein